MKDIIVNAYKNVEDINTFDSESYREYKKERLNYQSNIVNFFKKIKRENFNLLDIGSGSSALAYALVNKGMLGRADCVEPSFSRHNFAEQWKGEKEKYSNIFNYNLDIKNFDFKKDYYDTITIVDNTFSYIGIYYTEYEIHDILKNIFYSLSDNGILIIEVSLFKNFIRQLNVSTNQVVQEFELKTNLGLWEYRLIKDNIMNIQSKYINSKCEIKEKEENSRVYSEDELFSLFKNIGFKNIKSFADFNQNRYNSELSEKLIMVCKK